MKRNALRLETIKVGAEVRARTRFTHAQRVRRALILTPLATVWIGSTRASVQTRSVKRPDARREEVPGELRDFLRLFV